MSQTHISCLTFLHKIHIKNTGYEVYYKVTNLSSKPPISYGEIFFP